MKAVHFFSISITLLVTATGSQHLGAEPLFLEAVPVADQMQFSWPAVTTDSNQAQVFPEFQVQYSSDLKSWKPISGKLRAISGRSGPRLGLSLAAQPSPAFYRLSVDAASQALSETGDGGAEVFGFNARFANELKAAGQLSLDDFATNGAAIQYLPQLSWDPTNAQYWPNINAAFHLTSNELSLLVTNGFVVSERLGNSTFGDAYYQLFNGDLPTFVTADSVLHAWHRSYQSMLEELEEVELSTLLATMLNDMSAQLPQVWAQYQSSPLRDSILDTDYYLTVARSLWAGQQLSSALGDSSLDPQVTATLAGINRLDVETLDVFGSARTFDFSQFKVRGHYDASDRLRRYFKTMMWCGRSDLRLATFAPNKENDTRQLGTAIVMQWLLTQSSQYDNWSLIEAITRAFVGTTDSMTFAQLRDLLWAAGIQSPANVTSFQVLTNLQTRLLTGELGAQAIHSDFIYSPLGPEQVKMARSFTVCGQKFVEDSWAFSQVVYDRILWEGKNGLEKVARRKPFSLDVAFSVFGNDQVVPDIVGRILDTNGVPFRDGLPYQHNLLAVRRTIEAQDPGAWTNNIYTAWLAALRSLSAPTTDPAYPEAMRNRSWAMKNLNTQLASWTQLRHDSLLYAKQSYTEPGLCGYPAGFIEPRPEFWNSMRTLSGITAQAISALPLSGSVTISNRDPVNPGPITLNLRLIQSAQLSFLNNFSTVMTKLQVMSQRELDQQPFTPDETQFLRDIMENTIIYTGMRQYNGWYPRLFYSNVLGGNYAFPLPACGEPDPLVVDVHTDLPDPIVNDPGAVIHEAVGNINMLIIAIDNGPDRMMYAGPVLSHYEFEMLGVNRLSDSDWKTMLSSAPPAPPSWTRSYLSRRGQ